MKAPAKISPSNFALKNELCDSFSAPKSCATVTGGGDGALELSVTETAGAVTGGANSGAEPANSADCFWERSFVRPP